MNADPAVSRQNGIILAMALMFLALIAATAAVGPAVAGLELLRAGALDAWSRADAAALTGLATALAEGDLTSTSPRVIATDLTPSAGYSVRSEFLGFRTASADEAAAGLLEWHFTLTAAGTAGRGARVVQALHVYVLAPEPPDRSACMSDGCAVPPICADASACDPALNSPPVPVGWHVSVGAT